MKLLRWWWTEVDVQAGPDPTHITEYCEQDNPNPNGRVDRYLENPNAREFQGHHLSQLITETFGVSAQEFRAFILDGRLPRIKPSNAMKK